MLQTETPKKKQSVNNINQMHLNIPSETPIVDFLTAYGPKLLYALLGLLLLFFFVYRYTSNKKTDAISDYVSADVYFQRFATNIDAKNLVENEPYAKLIEIINRHPELQAKYDGNLAQILLERNNVAEAKVYADRVFKRIASDDVNDYVNYSQATLLLGDNQTQQALDSAKALQKSMKSALDSKGNDAYTFGAALYAFNELRIALLAPTQQTMNDLQKQLQDASNQSSSMKPLIKKGYQTLQQHFNNGSTNLSNYIEQQKKNIKS
jgi:hypothetical protein